MTKNTMNVAKGRGAGMIAGLAVGYVGSKVIGKDTKNLKKHAGKAVNAMGTVANDVTSMLK